MRLFLQKNAQNKLLIISLIKVLSERKGCLPRFKNIWLKGKRRKNAKDPEAPADPKSHVTNAHNVNALWLNLR